MADRINVPLLCCEALIALLGASNVLLPGTSGYNESLTSYWSLQASAVHPLCFVTPQTVADVSSVMKSLDTNNSCNIAVRSGGHTWFPGAASAPAGVTIDLRALDSVEVNAENSNVFVGMGATWDAVYAKLDPLNLSVAGGRVAGVGVGGLTLGGGISFFGARQGWTCNQVISYEVVLANGSVVEASENQNSDLWWGLRGGSNNFGIVTHINLTTFEQGLLWYTEYFNPITVVKDQAKIYSNLMAAQNYDENASFLTGWGYAEAQSLIIATNQLIYTQPVGNQTPAFYKDVLSLPTLTNESFIIGNMSTLAAVGAEPEQPQASRYFMGTTTFAATEEMLLAAFDAWNSTLQTVQNLTGITWTVNLEALPPQFYSRGAADNALGLGDRNDSLVICLVSPTWPDEAQDEQMYTAARILLNEIENKAKCLGAYDPYIYLDYAAPWQDVIASYGNASVSRLQQLRATVDPNGVFTKRVPGGFKIPY